MAALTLIGAHILLLGDSLTAYGPVGALVAGPITATTPSQAPAPGVFLGAYLLEAGAASVRRNAKVGRSAISFFESEDGDKLLTQEAAKPTTLVIVLLGTNDAGRDPVRTERYLMRIRAAFAETGIPVFGVGPPSFPTSGRGSTTSDGRDMNAEAAKVVTIEKRVFGANFIDARKMTADIVTYAQGRAGDGIHFQAAGGREWARRLAAVFGAEATRMLAAAVGPRLALATLVGLGSVATFVVQLAPQLARRQAA